MLSLTAHFLWQDILKHCFSCFQFFSWFAEVESEIEKEEDIQYRCHIEELESHRTQCDQVLDEVSSGLDHLMELQRQYINVSTKTNALHEACEHLLAEQVCTFDEVKIIDRYSGLNNCFHSYSSCRASDLKIHLPCSKTYLPCIFVW